MATRFYFTSRNSTLVIPFDASWEVTPVLDLRATLSPERKGSPFDIFFTAFVQNPVPPVDSLYAQFVSPPLSAQTISGDVKAIIRVLENASDADFRAQMSIRVFGMDGSTFRGTLLPHSTAGLTSEFATTLTNRKFPLAWTGAGAALTPVNAQQGDRLVVEVGFRAHSTWSGASFRDTTFEFGDASLTDCAEDEVGTAQNNPWIEFSNTLLLEPDYTARSASSSPLVSQLGRSNLGVAQAAGESYSHRGFTTESPLEGSTYRRARVRPLGAEVGSPFRVSNYNIDSLANAEGQDGGTLRSPIGGGGFPSGTNLVEKFKMRAEADPGPGYVTWVVTGSPDFLGAQAPAAILPGTAVISDLWTEF